MSITTEAERTGMQQASNAVAITLKKMREFAQPGMSTKDLDEYGGELLAQAGAKSAPKLTYNFPGYTCISLNEEAAHGIPSADKILKEGDLINIDVSAELNGYWPIMAAHLYWAKIFMAMANWLKHQKRY